MHHLCNKTYIERLINQYYKNLYKTYIERLINQYYKNLYKTYIERLINQYYKTIFLNQNLHWNMWSNQHGELFPKHLVLTPLFEAKLTIDYKINIQNEIEMLGNTD